MLQMLINFVMNIIITIISFVFTPFVTALTALFPAVGQYFTHILEFFSSAFTYLSTTTRWLLFQPSMFALLFDYYAIKFSIHILISTIKFALNMYNKLKP